MEILVLPNGFSGPCLRQVILSGVPFPELLKLLMSARDLVSFNLRYILPTCYIPPEAVVGRVGQLEYLCIFFSEIHRLEQRRGHPDPPMRAILPALTYFEFGGCSEHLDNLVADIDAPRLGGVRTDVNQLPVP